MGTPFSRSVRQMRTPPETTEPETAAKLDEGGSMVRLIRPQRSSQPPSAAAPPLPPAPPDDDHPLPIPPPPAAWASRAAPPDDEENERSDPERVDKLLDGMENALYHVRPKAWTPQLAAKYLKFAQAVVRQLVEIERAMPEAKREGEATGIDPAQVVARVAEFADRFAAFEERINEQKLLAQQLLEQRQRREAEVAQLAASEASLKEAEERNRRLTEEISELDKAAAALLANRDEGFALRIRSGVADLEKNTEALIAQHARVREAFALVAQQLRPQGEDDPRIGAALAAMPGVVTLKASEH